MTPGLFRKLLLVVALASPFSSSPAFAAPAGESAPAAETDVPRASSPSPTEAATATTAPAPEPAVTPAPLVVKPMKKERHYKTGLLVATAIVLGGSIVAGEIELVGGYCQWMGSVWTRFINRTDYGAVFELGFGALFSPVALAVSLLPGLNAYLVEQRIEYGNSVLGFDKTAATPIGLGLAAAQVVGLALAAATLITAEDVITPAPGRVSWHLLPGGPGAPLGATVVGIW